ncbi:MAG: DUF2069 domain-containing protein [Gammaproteobacteria bacterium]|nr:MAG: DUF2069 domain-containing protein [Gammaproteobacteria bacterium]
MNLESRVTFTFRAVMVLYALFLVLTGVDALWVYPEDGHPNVTIWVIGTLPLLVFLPGMLRRNFRSFIWLCFVLLFYFLKIVWDLGAAQVLWIDQCLLAVLVPLYTASMLFVRWHRALLRQQAPPAMTDSAISG